MNITDCFKVRDFIHAAVLGVGLGFVSLKPYRKRLLVDELRNRYRTSLSQTCTLLRLSAHGVRLQVVRK